MSTFFCSELARAENDQIFGTVKPVRLIVALEYWPAWDRKAINSELIPEEVRLFIKKLRLQVPEMRFLLIRQKESQHRRPSCFVVVPNDEESALYQIQLDDWRDLALLDMASMLNGTTTYSQKREPMFLVCNHGKHDRCCAKYGTAVLDALRGENGQGVWESSHLGGCRFAANMVCLPHGLGYGHLTQVMSVAAMQEYRSGRILLPHFRGRSNYPRPVQAAEYFLRRETGILDIDHVRFIRTQQVGANRWNTVFRFQQEKTLGVVEHGSSPSESRRQLACGDPEPETLWVDHLVTHSRLIEYRE